MIGSTVSHYRITHLLGRGGMGEVYRADDEKLERSVALKFLSEQTTSREARVRFLREARAAAALQHPNICTVHEVGEHEGTSFIVMALVEGHDLRSQIEAGPSSIRTALDIAIQVAEGLEFAHSRQIVHRDIKPANIMVDDSGRATIMDFGLAKLIDATAVTHTGATMGTPWYMAPEQVRGSDVDRRADVWSLGVILFEMLSGRRPFEADTLPAVMHHILNEDAPDLSQVCEGVPDELDWIVAKCLAKDLEQRYASAGELREDLEALRAKLTEQDDATLVVRARPIGRRKGSSWLRVGGGVVAAIAAVMLGYWINSTRMDEEPVGEVASVAEVKWSTPPRVAVVSFDNRTGDSSLDYVSGLAADQIANGLATTELVDVVPLEVDPSAETVSLAALLQASNADVAVTGSFYQDGDGIMVQARVVDSRSAGLVFSVPAARAMREAPRAALESVSQRVAGGLAIRVDNPFEVLVPAVPPTWEAFEEYRTALDLFLNSQNAVGRFERAAEFDSLFVRPRVLAVLTRCANPFQIAFADADTALMKLMESEDLDEYDLEMARMLSDIVHRNHEGAANMALRLEAIAPRDKLVQAMKVIRLGGAGRHQEALRTYYGIEFEPEMRRRPAVAGLNRIVANSAHALGRFDEELRLRRELLRFFPTHPLFHLDLLWPFAAKGEIDSMHAVVGEALARPGTRGYIDFMVWTSAGVLRGHEHADAAPDFVNWYLERRPDRPEDDARQSQMNNYANLLYHAERWDDARDAFTANVESGSANEDVASDARMMIGMIAARQGDREAGEAALDAYLADFDNPYNRSLPDRMRAELAAVLGDRDDAVRHLQQAAARGAGLGHDLGHDIDLEQLLGYPPFEELIAGR